MLLLLSFCSDEQETNIRTEALNNKQVRIFIFIRYRSSLCKNKLNLEKFLRVGADGGRVTGGVGGGGEGVAGHGGRRVDGGADSKVDDDRDRKSVV